MVDILWQLLSIVGVIYLNFEIFVAVAIHKIMQRRRQENIKKVKMNRRGVSPMLVVPAPSCIQEPYLPGDEMLPSYKDKKDAPAVTVSPTTIPNLIEASPIVPTVAVSPTPVRVQSLRVCDLIEHFNKLGDLSPPSPADAKQRKMIHAVPDNHTDQNRSRAVANKRKLGAESPFTPTKFMKTGKRAVVFDRFPSRVLT